MIIETKLLPGEPLDGSGKVCIHLFVQDPDGLVVEPHAVLPVFENGAQVKQKTSCGPAHGRIACNPKIMNVQPVIRGNVTTLFHRTDDPRAVSCPKCKASKDYEAMIAKMKALDIL